MKTATILITSALLVSCHAQSALPTRPPSGAMAASEKRVSPAIDVSKPETLIGQPHAAVKAACDAAGVRNRIIELDGKPQPVTRDYRPDRLNFRVSDGKVTAVSKG
ncbi:hypothetical protein HZ994_10355 [Akkermansiaceae bacterium]|nr:hypothetical protein HZ994_10355 [Akkermansiaceae bacterium]